MPGGEGGPCPECEIIILSYAKIPAETETVKWRALAIEDLYGTSFVQSKIAANPALHQENLTKLKAVLQSLKDNRQVLDGIIADLAP